MRDPEDLVPDDLLPPDDAEVRVSVLVMDGPLLRLPDGAAGLWVVVFLMLTGDVVFFGAGLLLLPILIWIFGCVLPGPPTGLGPPLGLVL